MRERPPRIEIEPYDTTVGDLDEDDLDEWADRVRSSLTSWPNWPHQSNNDPRESPVKRLVVLAGERYIEPLEQRDVFGGNVGSTVTRRCPGLPTVPEFPFREHDFDGIGEQMAWLKERSKALEAAGPSSRSELSSFDAGYDRDRALWQLDQPAIDIEGTEQASLNEIEVPDTYRKTTQITLHN